MRTLIICVGPSYRVTEHYAHDLRRQLPPSVSVRVEGKWTRAQAYRGLDPQTTAVHVVTPEGHMPDPRWLGALRELEAITRHGLGLVIHQVTV